MFTFSKKFYNVFFGEISYNLSIGENILIIMYFNIH